MNLLLVGFASSIPLFGILLAIPLSAGNQICLLKIIKKEQINYNDYLWAFDNLNRFIHIMLLGGMIMAITFLGFACLIIPGIYLAVILSFGSNIFVLYKQDAVEALKYSFQLVKGRWWKCFGIFILVLLLNLLGVLLFGIGIIITTPLSTLIWIHLTEWLRETQAPVVLEASTIE